MAASVPSVSGSRRVRRRVLALTTALGSLALFPALAHAQATGEVKLPTQGKVTSGVAEITTPGDGQLNVKLKTGSTVIEWNGFNIPEDSAAKFTNGTNAANVAVLNKDVSTNVSQLLGRLESDKGVAVWVYNPNGIVVGQGAVLNTGSLVLTTLKPTDNILDSGSDASFNFKADAGKGGSSITVANGAQITLKGGNRGLVMVAPKIEAAGTFDAGDQDLAFVTASDVTLTYNQNSPLSVTLKSGTEVKGRSQYVSGTVAGRNAIFALASKSDITDSLLQVDGNVTATAGSRGIVLSAGKPGAGIDGVEVARNAAGIDGSVALAVGGALSTKTNGSVLASASGAATFGGDIVSARAVGIEAQAALDVAGSVRAAGNLTFAGAGVTLGGANAVEQTAGGKISVRSTDGNITGRGALTLRSGAGGNDSLILRTEGAKAGDILLGTESALNAGGRDGRLTLELRDAANAVSIGDVAASTLRWKVGNGGPNEKLTLTSGVTLGDVKIDNGLSIEAASIATGAVDAGGEINLKSAAGISTAALLAGDAVTLSAVGDIAVTGDIRAGTRSDVTIDAPGAITLRGVRAGEDIVIGGTKPATSVAVTGAVDAGANYKINADRVILGGSGAVQQAAAGAITITAGSGGITGLSGLTLLSDSNDNDRGNLTLAIDPARVAAAAGGGAIDFAADTKLSGGTDRSTTVEIRSADAAGAVSLGDVEARALSGAVGSDEFADGLTRTGALRTGAVSLRENLILSGSAVETGALSTEGAVRLIASEGGITTGAITALGSASAEAAGALTVGKVSAREVKLSGSTVAAGALTATNGGVGVSASTGDVTAAAISATRNVSVKAPGAITLGGIAAGGTANAQAGAALTIGGDVSASAMTLSGSTIVAGALTTTDEGVIATATEGSIVTNAIASAREVALTAPGSILTGSITASGSATAEAVGALTVGTVSAREVKLSGAAVDAGALTATNGGVGVTASTGGVTTAAISATRNVSVKAPGAITLGGITAGGTAAAQTDAALTIGGRVSGTGVTLSGSTVQAKAVAATAGGLRIGATEGGITTAALSASQGISITAPGALSVGALTAGGAIVADVGGALTVGGDVDAGELTLRGNAVALDGQSVRSAGKIDLLARSGGIASRGALALTSTSGDEADFIRLQAAGPEGIVLADGSTITGGANRALDVRIFNGVADAPLVLGDVTARSLGMLDQLDGGQGGAFRSQGSLTFGRLNLVQGFAAESLGGDVTVEAIAVTGQGQGIDLRASNGTLSIQNDLSTSGAITLASGTALSLGRVESRDAAVSLTSAGAVSAGTLLGKTGVTATGATLTVGDAQGGAIDLTATAGNLSLGRADGSAVRLSAAGGAISTTGEVIARAGAVDFAAAGDITAAGRIDAQSGGVRLQSTGGTVAATGGIGATGDVTLAGSALTLRGAQRAGGSYTATASAGGIANGGGLSIRAGANGADGATLTLSATGGAIALDGAVLDAGTLGAVGLSTDGGGIAVGNVTTASLTATGATAAGSAIRTGNLTLGGPLTLQAAGDVITGRIDAAGAATIASDAGNTTVGDVTTDGAVALSGGSVRFGALRAASLTATAATGALTGGDVTTGGAVAIDAGAGSVTLGEVTTTQGAVSLLAGAGLTAARVAAGGTATLTSTGAGFNTSVANGVSSGGSLTIGSGGDIVTPSLESGGDLTILAPNGALRSEGGNGVDLVWRTGSAFTLAVGTDAQLGDVIGGGDISISARSLSARNVNGGTNAVTLRATGGDLTISGSVTGGAVTLDSVGATRLGTVDASGALVLGGGQRLSFTDVSGATIKASGGFITGNSVRSLGTAALAGDGVLIGTIGAAGALSVDSGAGDLSLGTVGGGSTVTLGTAGSATLGSVTAAQALTLNAGTLSFGELAGNTVGVTAGSIDGGTLRATDAATVVGTGVAIDAVDAGGTLAINAGTGALSLGTATSRGVTLSGGSAALASVSATETLKLTIAQDLSFGELSGGSVEASAGAVEGDTLRATGAATVRGTGIAIDTTEVGGALSLDAGVGALTLGTATGKSVTLSGGSATLGTIAATEALKLTIGEDLSFGELSGGSVEASAGAIDGDTLRSTGTSTVRGTRIAIDTTEVGGVLSLDAGVGALTLGTAMGKSVTLAGGSATLGTVAATEGLKLTVGEDLSFGELSGESVEASAGAIYGDTLQSTGAASVRGTGIAIGTADVGGALAIDAGAGSLTLGSVDGRGDVGLTAGGGATLGRVAAAQALIVAIGGDLSFTELAGGSIGGSAGAVRGAALRATGAVDLRGGTIELTSADAGGALALTATDGGLVLGSASAGGDVAVGASDLLRVDGAVTAGGDYRVTGGSVQLGGAGVTQRAGGAVTVTATSGDIRGGSGLTLVSGAGGAGGAMVLDAAGGIELGDTVLQAQPGSGAALGLRAGSGRAIRLGSVEAGSIGGFDGTNALDRLVHDGNFETGDLRVGRMAVTLGAGDLRTGRIDSSGALAIEAAAGAVTTGDLNAASLDLRSGNGLAIGTAKVVGAAALRGGAIIAAGVEAGTLTVETPGSLSGIDGGRVSLRTTAGDLSVDAGSARLDRVESAGAIGLRGGRIDVAGPIAAARQLLVEAREALAIGDASAGGDLTLGSAGELSAGALGTKGTLKADGATMTIGSARADGGLALTSGGALSLGSGTANGIAIDAAGLATVGALSGGSSIDLVAGDAELTGDVRASTVRFATRDPARTALRIGDGTESDGFHLSNAEVARVGADTLRFDAATGKLEVGGLSLAAAAGRTIEMLSTGDVEVTGVVSSTGTGRSIRIGGDAGAGNAGTIHVIATSDAGGRLLVDGADLELRGDRIAVGLEPNFIGTLLPGDAGRDQAAALIGNPNSVLYNPQLGGGFFDPSATTTVAARSLTVRFGDYALFQNTAIAGETSGMVLGGADVPIAPALRVSSYGTPGLGSVAVFGRINGIAGASAALIGRPVIDIDPGLLGSSRINGCLAGSGAGCLTTIVIQPTLQVFEWDSQAVFGISQDVAVPFTPIVGGNNEELLTGLPALAPEAPETSRQPSAAREPQQ
ncbi:filamentous hemagglutinin N-terminal domain-containing protein [Sphingomonas sp. ac-8]|uniref:two-partner secretion domain-containing protein n=1 Tax=Sphingomonas sp. ac-8 TaxID=3242977 RepID=UPI003A7FAC55